MTAKKITAMDALGAAPANDDQFVIVDVSDTTEAATGTTKKLEASRVARVGAANTFTTAQTFTGSVAAETGSQAPGVGLSFDSTTVVSSSTLYLLVVRVISGASAIVGHTVSVISRQGTGTRIDNLATNAYTTVACDSGTNYNVRITNVGALNYTYGYSLLRLQ